MADKQETAADIVAELREISKMQTCGYICQEQIVEKWNRRPVMQGEEVGGQP